MRGELAGWAARRAPDIVARAEAEAVAELKAALIAAATRAEAAPPAPASRPRARAATAGAPAEGSAVWAYCVARETPDAGGPGVDPAGETRWIREGELALLCSAVPLAEFGEEPLRRNLNDLAWLERVARGHEAAIERALERTTIVPLRLCTIFAGEPQARRMLADRAAELTASLEALDGRVEWSVKLIVDRERLEATLREPGEPEHDPGSGAAYMLLRREERRLAEAVDRAANELAEDVHARLQDWAADARVRPAQNRELSGHVGEMVLNGAYLVDRTKTGELRELVEQLQQRHAGAGARLELGGPFPPYNFVPEGGA